MNNNSNFYNLPYKTEEILKGFKPAEACKNLGLLLDKYIPKNVFEKAGKTRWLFDIFRPQNEKETQNTHIDEVFAKNAYQRWQKMMESLGAETFDLTLDWRMVVGLGGETVLETDLTLNHLYGIPYIPGSALKGLTRGYVTGEVFPSKDIEHDNEIVKRIFGSQEHAGTVVFFDAMPTNGTAKFALDIMNPHYPDYYGKGAPPTNDQSPNPITFLTVAETTFAFALAPRSGNSQYMKDVEQTKIWLQEALQKYGVGGKTSAGYGYFKNVHDADESASIAQSSQATVTPIPKQKPVATEHIRPGIPKFREGQEITGAVIAPTDEMRQKVPDASAFLRYQSYQTKDVLIVVNAEEAENWKPGETRICLFMHEEVRDGCTVLVCQPRPSKKKKG